MTKRMGKKRRKQIGLHLFRMAVFCIILLLIRMHHSDFLASKTSPGFKLEVADVLKYFPEATKVRVSGKLNDTLVVEDINGNEIGTVLETSPQTDHLVGFSGPTNCRIAISNTQNIRSVEIVSSGDTVEHVEKVKREAGFFEQFDGANVRELEQLPIDGVSGATLTSLAIAESVLQRLTDRRTQSLKFPGEIRINDVQRLFPNAVELQPTKGFRAWQANDDRGNSLGWVVRSSPHADHEIGYQGPSEILMAFNTDDVVVGWTLLDSFENQPYVRYVKEDQEFANTLIGQSLTNIANLDPVDSRFEGVSGATMTSQSIVAGFRTTVQAYLKHREKTERGVLDFLHSRDLGTIAIVVIALFAAFTRWRGHRFSRIVFQLALIGYLGWTNGDFVSQALVVGWAQTSVPWSTAFGLMVLTTAAITIPVTSGRNVYCHHICPHGAVQELIKNRIPWRIRLTRRFRLVVRMIPPLLIAWCVLVAMLHLPFGLVNIEPFNAWVFSVAGWATIAVAVIGLTVSLFIPMAYCRFGCPTGAMLKFLRFNSASDRWSRSDTFACCLLVLVITLRFLS